MKGGVNKLTKNNNLTIVWGAAHLEVIEFLELLLELVDLALQLDLLLLQLRHLHFAVQHSKSTSP